MVRGREREVRGQEGCGSAGARNPRSHSCSELRNCVEVEVAVLGSRP